MPEEKKIDRAYFEEAFRALPEEYERDYEKQVVRLGTCAEEKVLRPVLEELLADGTAPEPERYAAYCSLHSRYRRMRDHQKLKDLCNRYESTFRAHPSAEHFSLLVYVDMGDPFDEPVLMRAERSIERMLGTAGAQHLLADLVALYYEREGNHHLLGTEKAASWLEKAMTAVNQAISADDYAKFHYTKARLLCLQENYKAALDEVSLAVDKEDSSRPDYAIRMATYLSEKMRIESIEHQDRYLKKIQEDQTAAESKIQEQMDKLSDSSVKSLEFLGLFAGIISFTIGGISIVSNASSFSFQGAAGLLIVLMGTLLEVFCGFGVILHGLGREKSVWLRNLVVLAFGAVMIGLGLVLCRGL